MELIKVSVIVPVYNAMKYLETTVDSIRNQTLEDIEMIFVDDGSTDDTLEFLNRIKDEDKRVTVLSQKNSYAGVARNNGLAVAKGKYVVFWDADDIFFPEALTEMFEQCEKDEADICLCGASHYDEVLDKYVSAPTYLKNERLPEKTPFGHKEIDRYLFNFSTNVPWNKMFRRSFLLENDIKFQDIQQANDNYFIMLAYFYAKSFTYVNKVLINYRVNFETSLTGNASKTPLCVYEAYKKTYETLKTEDNFKNVKQSFYNKTIRGFFYFLGKQTYFESYRILYDKYKEDVLKKWNFPICEEYYYSKKDYKRLIRVLEMTAEDFLLEEFRNSFNDAAILKDRNKTLKTKNAALKEKNTKLKEKRDKLKESNNRLKEKLTEIKNSNSYKIGKFITYIPGKIKKWIKGKSN